MPSLRQQELIPLISNIAKKVFITVSYELSDTVEWDASIPEPVISKNVITKFLERVHSFTVVDLEAQATAFSYQHNGVIKFLALLPQINNVSTVASAGRT